MEVGQAATYIDPTGKSRDCLIAKIRPDEKVNIVVVNADGGEDDFGRLRAEIDGLPVGHRKGAVCGLDDWDEDKQKKAKPKAKSSKKKATKKKAS